MSLSALGRFVARALETVGIMGRAMAGQSSPGVPDAGETAVWRAGTPGAGPKEHRP